MENSNQELTINFDKTKLKDLLIHQIATHLQQQWSADEVIEMFVDSPFNFIESGKTKAEKLNELIATHKIALRNEVNLEVKI